MDLRPCKKSEDPAWKNHTPLCAEVDFCSSAHIEQIVEDAIKAQLDMKIHRAMKRREAVENRWFRENG